MHVTLAIREDYREKQVVVFWPPSSGGSSAVLGNLNTEARAHTNSLKLLTVSFLQSLEMPVFIFLLLLSALTI